MKLITTIIILLMAAAAFAAPPEIYYLPNGMEVALIENHAAPVIASSIIVRTGLRDETPEVIGASHFLEHLLFNGTTHRTQKELYEEMDLIGGYNNAHTGDNFTNFVILTGKDNFEKGLEIQTDMLFNSTLPNDKFEKERGIVIEEIGGAHDRASYLADIHFSARFFKGSPYANQILGSKTSIEKMKRDAVVKYYKSRFRPNNMTAIIAGDFDPQAIKPILEKYLGAPSPGEIPERKLLYLYLPYEAGIAPIRIHREKTRSVNLRAGIPLLGAPEEWLYTADILTEMLEKRLNDQLTSGEKPAAQSISLEYFLDRDFGAIILRASLSGEDNIEPAVTAFRECFRIFSEETIAADEVQNVVTSRRSQALFNSERPHFAAMMQANMLAFNGYEYVMEYQDNLQRVTPEALQELARGMYEYAPLVASAVVPYAEGEDWKERASAGKIHREILTNGLEIIVTPGSGSGVFAAHFLFKNRCLNELPGKTGITDFLHQLLLKGTTQRTQAELEAEINRLGMRLETSDNPWIPFDDYRTVPEFSFVRMETAEEYWRPALKLTAEVIRQPAFNPGNVESTRGMLIGAAARKNASAKAKARSLFLKKLLGKNAAAKPTSGTPRTLGGITTAELADYHRRYFAPDNMIITVVGNLPPEEIAAELRSLFADMQPSGIEAPPNPPPQSQLGEYREELCKMQSYIYLGYLIEEIPEEDRAPLIVANAILSDRLQFNLREQQGLAYSIGSAVVLKEGWGYFYAYIGTRPENIDKALKGIKTEIKAAAKADFKQNEVTKAVNSYLARRDMRRLLSVNRASFAGIYAMEGKPLDSGETWAESVKAVTLEQVWKAAEKYFRTDNLVVAVVE